MYIPEKIQNIAADPIEHINDHASKQRQKGANVINLGQAIPDFDIVDEALESARKALEEKNTNIYSPDPGLLVLREKISEWLEKSSHIKCDPKKEIIVTAGANQAFMVAMLTLLEPGDKVLLPSPYFFNHEMAVRIAGGIPIEIPLKEEYGFQLRLEDLKPYLEMSPRILVIVSPNNPTGAVYDSKELERIGIAAASKDIVIVTDETYSDFVYETAQHISLASIPEISSQVITIGSFSKIFSMTGWRVGFLTAEPNFIKEALKIQDSLIICAPVISQKVALGALYESSHVFAQRRAMLNQRRQLLIKLLNRIPNISWHPTFGAFFAFVKIKNCRNSQKLAMDILEREHIVTIPGSVFGKNGEGYIRLSYGSAKLSILEEACKRLKNYFSSL